jgi:hypothetical protein
MYTSPTNRLKVAIIYSQKPNFDEYAFKYFLLSLNKLQSTYEFTFPDLDSYVFAEGPIDFSSSLDQLDAFVSNQPILCDFSVGIVTGSFNNNYFFSSGYNSAIITTDVWEKYLSPPSLFEYLLHCIYCCLIYSEKKKNDPSNFNDKKFLDICSHSDTRGCIADFTRFKKDDRVDIALGYICDEHKEKIIKVFGEDYLLETTKVLERTWIGKINDEGSVAYNLKHIFKFDINRDSGFNKNFWDKCKDKFYEIPGDTLGEVTKILAATVIAYLLIKLGIEVAK